MDQVAQRMWHVCSLSEKRAVLNCGAQFVDIERPAEGHALELFESLIVDQAIDQTAIETLTTRKRFWVPIDSDGSDLA